MINSLTETAQKIGENLISKNITISCAESCTGGLFAAYLTSVSGISSVFECGIVTYSNRIKAEKLGVSAETLEEFGAVSSQTAIQMAQGIRRVASSDIGVSVTGVAGPDSSEGKKPGTVFIALSDGKETMSEKLDIEPKSRDYVREQSVHSIFKLILKYIKKRYPNE